MTLGFRSECTDSRLHPPLFSFSYCSVLTKESRCGLVSVLTSSATSTRTIVVVPVSPLFPQLPHIAYDYAAVDGVVGLQLDVVGDDWVGVRDLVLVVVQNL